MATPAPNQALPNPAPVPPNPVVQPPLPKVDLPELGLFLATFTPESTIKRAVANFHAAPVDGSMLGNRKSIVHLLPGALAGDIVFNIYSSEAHNPFTTTFAGDFEQTISVDGQIRQTGSDMASDYPINVLLLRKL